MTSLVHALPAAHPDLAACVIVPCKNEAAHLESALTALANQVDLNGRTFAPNRFEIILLVNNSTDESFALARRFQLTRPWFPLHLLDRNFPPEHAHIGYVRKLLMDTAAHRLSIHPKPLSVIASTDADTEIASDWLAQTLAEIGRGAGAVGGRILLSAGEVRQLDERTRRLQFNDDRYNLLVSWLEHRIDPQPYDPWPRHHQHFGASLAVVPEIYRQVGGLPCKEWLEDVALYDVLFRHDVPFRHSPDVCVHTSARLQSKTTVGLAYQLSCWSKSRSQIIVPSVRFWTALFSLRKRLRFAHEMLHSGQRCPRLALNSLAADCGCPPNQLEQALEGRHFGAAFQSFDLPGKLEHGSLATPARQPLEDALHLLQQQFFASHSSASSLTQTTQSGISAP